MVKGYKLQLTSKPEFSMRFEGCTELVPNKTYILDYKEAPEATCEPVVREVEEIVRETKKPYGFIHSDRSLPSSAYVCFWNEERSSTTWSGGNQYTDIEKIKTTAVRRK